jgi:hypothetical protein
LAGSSDHVQQADINSHKRRFPHMWLNGPYNAYGFDKGNELIPQTLQCLKYLLTLLPFSLQA